MTVVPFQYKDRLSRYGIPMSKIRRSRNRIIFNMGIPVLVRQRLYTETPPGRYGGQIRKYFYPSFGHKHVHQLPW